MYYCNYYYYYNLSAVSFLFGCSDYFTKESYFKSHLIKCVMKFFYIYAIKSDSR